MRELTVQIERLPAMRVATIAVTNASPEEEAIAALLDWARPQGLLEGNFRFFGYDNCEPHPNHIYTTMLTVADDVQASGHVTIKDVAGGLYAVVDCVGVEQISPQWKALAQWVENSAYDFATQTGIEEHLDMLGDVPPDAQRFKLYLTISE